MKTTKKKGFTLAMVIILTLVMTIAVSSAFTIIMRYMFLAKDNTEKLTGEVIYYTDDFDKEGNIDACI